MATYNVSILWERNDAAFTDHRYSRGHRWRFDGLEIPASSSPHVVPLPMSVHDAVDPEEAFVASLASCHMLWFLSIAAKRGYVVDKYSDDASGVMAKDPEGKWWMTEVILRPNVSFVGDHRPTVTDEDAMHHQSHEQCFIANSVKTHVKCEPVRG